MAMFPINPFGSFGYYGFGMAEPYDQGQAFDMSSGMMGAAGAIYYGGVGTGLPVGGVGRWMDRFLAKHPVEAPEQEQPKEVPAGTDSTDYSQRAGAYFRNRGNLPSQSDVMHNLLGKNASDDLKTKERKKDKVLRESVDIARGWMKDPKACGEAYRKLQNANDHVGKVKAIFDPYGDGRYLKEFGEVVKGLQNAQDQEGADKNWKLVADWFAREVGSGVIDTLVAEISATPEMQPGNIGSETPLADKNKYIKELKDKNYTDDEVSTLLSALRTEEETDEVVKSLGQMKMGDTQDVDRQIKDAKANLKDAQGRKNKEAWQRKIDGLEEAKTKLLHDRTEQFMRDLLSGAWFASRYGKTARDLGCTDKDGIIKRPDSVNTVEQAVKWIYDQLGRNVNVPTSTNAAITS